MLRLLSGIIPIQFLPLRFIQLQQFSSQSFSDIQWCATRVSSRYLTSPWYHHRCGLGVKHQESFPVILASLHFNIFKNLTKTETNTHTHSPSRDILPKKCFIRPFTSIISSPQCKSEVMPPPPPPLTYFFVLFQFCWQYFILLSHSSPCFWTIIILSPFVSLVEPFMVIIISSTFLFFVFGW